MALGRGFEHSEVKKNASEGSYYTPKNNLKKIFCFAYFGCPLLFCTVYWRSLLEIERPAV
jgi:hypothetical protein